MWLDQEKLAKNTTIYQNLVIFSWLYILFFFFLSRKYFEIIIDFYFYHYGSYRTK